MPARSPEEIHALLAAAVNAGDVDAFAELHEPDATVIVPPDGRRVSGRDAIRAAVRPVLALGPTAEIELVDSSSRAISRSRSRGSRCSAPSAAGRSCPAARRTGPGASCSTTR
jgi:hypothetical protein